MINPNSSLEPRATVGASPAREWGKQSHAGRAPTIDESPNELSWIKSFLSLFCAVKKSKPEVAISYFGRTSEFLLMTSERMVIPDGTYTLGQVLNKLRKRGNRWAYELDDSHVVCTVDGKAASLSDTVEAGVEINIFSRKSIFAI